jgi:hypothetical protein
MSNLNNNAISQYHTNGSIYHLNNHNNSFHNSQTAQKILHYHQPFQQQFHPLHQQFHHLTHSHQPHQHRHAHQQPPAFPTNFKDTRWLTLEVCREFQRNKCNRTETDCKFAHPLPHVEVLNGKVIACYDSLKV